VVTVKLLHLFLTRTVILTTTTLSEDRGILALELIRHQEGDRQSHSYFPQEQGAATELC
jgi:hypothetical protein